MSRERTTKSWRFCVAGGLHRAARMRGGSIVVVVVSCATGAVACVDREADDPGAALRSSAIGHGTVRCRADEDGNLHVRAPADARVIAPADAVEGATADIAWAPEDDVAQMPRPVRPRSRSLGFIGDGKLTETPRAEDRWSYGAHDDLLPPHPHPSHPPHPAVWPGAYGYRRYP